MLFQRLSESSRPLSKPLSDRKPPHRMGATTPQSICMNISFRNIVRCLTPISLRSSLTRIASRSPIFASAQMFTQTSRHALGSQAAVCGPQCCAQPATNLGVGYRGHDEHL
jgi:hypothetical protein